MKKIQKKKSEDRQERNTGSRRDSEQIQEKRQENKGDILWLELLQTLWTRFRKLQGSKTAHEGQAWKESKLQARWLLWLK